MGKKNYDMLYQNFEDLLRPHSGRLGTGPELDQLQCGLLGMISPANKTFLFGAEQSRLPEIIKWMTGQDVPQENGRLRVPVWLVYGETSRYTAYKGGAATEIMPPSALPDGTEYICIEIPDRRFEGCTLYAETLLDGSDAFKRAVSGDNIILAVNLNASIGLCDRQVCEAVRDRWGRPQRIGFILEDFGGNAMPNTMYRVLTNILGDPNQDSSCCILGEMGDEAAGQLRQLWQEVNNKVDRTANLDALFQSIGRIVQKKVDGAVSQYDGEIREQRTALRRWKEKVDIFAAQRELYDIRLDQMIDNDLQDSITKDVTAFVVNLQEKLPDELRSAGCNEQITIYVPYYYSYLLSEFMEQELHERLLPVIQDKFDGIAQEIKEKYIKLFGGEIPDGLAALLNVHKNAFLEVDDRTRLIQGKVDTGIFASIFTLLLTSATGNPVFYILEDLIRGGVNLLANAVFDFAKHKLLPKDTYVEMACKSINKALDKNLVNLQNQFRENLFPVIRKELSRVLGQFVRQAAEYPATQLAEMKKRFDSDNQNYKSLLTLQDNLQDFLRHNF